ncbi:MAG: metal-dependent transcriptional regulator [Planctomycetes bacterium]|nr:metal-dependent transcriptional regulator [Planctomycetota bacterium]
MAARKGKSGKTGRSGSGKARADGAAAPASGGRALSANMEDYIEAIYRLSREEGSCRVSHIAETLDVKRPSVSKAVQRLQRRGLVRHTPYGGVTMTEHGRAVAEHQVRTHRVLTRFLTQVLKLPAELAEHDACLMEHAISHATVERLVQFIDHLEVNGSGKSFRKGRGKDAKASAALRRAMGRSWTSRV